MPVRRARPPCEPARQPSGRGRAHDAAPHHPPRNAVRPGQRWHGYDGPCVHLLQREHHERLRVSVRPFTPGLEMAGSAADRNLTRTPTTGSATLPAGPSGLDVAQLAGERFRLKRHLGAGASKDVFLAEDLTLRRDVALAFIS